MVVVGHPPGLAPDQLVPVAVPTVAHGRVEPYRAPAAHPAKRAQRCLCLLELVGVLQRIETIGAERPPLPSGLKIEKSGSRRVVIQAHESVGVIEAGVMGVAVAATVGGRTEKGQPPAADGARKVAIGIAVRPACRLETQVALRERGRADVDGPGVSPHAGHGVDELHARHPLHIHRQRMGLVPGTGIREIDSVEQHHRLVEGTSPYRNVGLNTLATPFPHVDRRAEAQCGLQGLQRRGGLRTAVENDGLRHQAARGVLFAPHDPHPFDLDLAVNGEGVGGKGRSA